MSAKKSLFSRLFNAKSDSDCCAVSIVADDEDLPTVTPPEEPSTGSASRANAESEGTDDHDQ